jgi:hypothetical protein
VTRQGRNFFKILVCKETNQGKDKVLQDLLNLRYSNVTILKIKHEKYLADPAGCNHYIGR